MKKLAAWVVFVCMIFTCVPAFSVYADEPAGGVGGLEEYLKASAALENDGYIGVPVDLYTYYKDTPTEQTKVILYVINTNTKRTGTASDYDILRDFIENKGCTVVVADYKNSEKAKTPDLDWSLAKIAVAVNERGEYLNGQKYAYNRVFIVPSGYSVAFDEYYFSYDKHGTDGCFDQIVKMWNSDFKGVYGDKTITYKDGSTKKVKEVEAKTIYDCVNPDGTPLNMDLKMDIVYPVNPEKEVPVMCLATSDAARLSVWVCSDRPHLTGFLFSGYAGAIMDFAYVPMASSWGYFDGNGSGVSGGVTGDNYTYSLGVYTGVKADTAAIRKLRWLSDYKKDTYKFDVSKIGIYGNSKAGPCLRIGEEHPEKLQEQRLFVGHHGETRYENGDTQGDGKGDDGSDIIRGGEPQPWLTYQDGSEIPSNVQFVYANCGDGIENISKNHAATYATASMEGDRETIFYANIVDACRTYDIPCLYLGFPELGHALVGNMKDKDYGINGYNALFDIANYYLKGDGAAIEYIKMNETQQAPVDSEITFKFSGAVGENEIKKITVTNKSTKKTVSGSFSASFGNTEWLFKPHGLEGGYEYEINVPDTIVCENGKNLINSKKMSFKTKFEKTYEAYKIYDDADMTLLKTESTDSSVYFMFKETDFSNTPYVRLRFSTLNDAANNVLVYGVEDLDEENLKNSKQGKLLGKISLTGADDYEIDVTDYVKDLNGKKPAFILKAEKKKETKVITNCDFENETVGSDDISTGGISKQIDCFVSDEKNTTEGGSKSVKFGYNKDNNYNNGKYHTWIEKMMNAYSSMRILKAADLTDEDIGRKLHVSFKFYDETSRRLRFLVYPFISGDYDDIDSNVIMYNEITVPNQWTTYEFDYRIKNERDIAQNKKSFVLQMGAVGKEQNVAAYLDDIVITEQITDVKVAGGSGENSFAPSLVVYPSSQTVLQSADSAYVESGKLSDTQIDSDCLKVNGRALSANDSGSKTYVKLDIESYGGEQAYFKFKTTADSRGTLEVYGLSGKEECENWKSSAINYLNAPANDVYTNGIQKDKAYMQDTLERYEINGEGEYSVDVSEYAQYMKNKGARYITLVFVSTSKPEVLTKKYNFDQAVDAIRTAAGGGLSDYGKTTDEDHSGSDGRSYYIGKPGRLKLDLLGGYHLFETKDIGRSFKITYWAKADAPTSFKNTTVPIVGYITHHSKEQKITKANEWQQFTYEFTLDKTDITDVSQDATARETKLFTMISFEGVNGSDRIYIDDAAVYETNLSNITIVPVKGNNKLVSYNSFNDWTVGEISASNTEADCVTAAKTFARAGFGNECNTRIVDTEDAGGDGKSFAFVPSGPWNMVKFYNVFDHSPTAADVGRRLKISFKVKSDVSGGFTYGLTSVMARNSRTGTYQVAEDEELDDQNYSGVLYPKTNSGTTAAGEWKTYSFIVDVDELMLHKTVYYTSYGRNFKQAIGMFTFVPGSDLKDKNVYIDDIRTEELDKNDPYNGGWEQKVVSKNDFSDWTVGAAESSNTEADCVTSNHVFARAGFGNECNTRIVDTEDADGSGKSFAFVPSGPWNRFKFYNVFDHSPTAADVGRRFKVSFKVKSDASGEFTYGLTSVMARNSRTDTYQVAEDEELDDQNYSSVLYPKTNSGTTVAGEWKTYSFIVDVDELMLHKTVYYTSYGRNFKQAIGLLTFIPGSDLTGKNVYIDDICTTELDKNAPLISDKLYSAVYDFENVSDASKVQEGNGLEWRAVDENGVLWNSAAENAPMKLIDTTEISTDENHGTGGAKSLKFTSHASWNRFKLLNITDSLGDDKKDITYKISFYVKPNKAGVINIGLIGSNSNKNKYESGGECGSTAYNVKSVTIDKANEWQKVSYEVKIDDVIINNNLNCLMINPKFGQSLLTKTDAATGKDYTESQNKAVFYIDDVFVKEAVGNYGKTFTVKEAAAVGADGKNNTSVLSACGAADKDEKYVRKAYFKFDGNEFSNVLRANLNFNVTNADKQDIYVWAISKNLEYPAAVTYNNAPANSKDETMSDFGVYGGSFIKKLSLNGDGTYGVNVTDYLNYAGSGDMVFAITAKNICGQEYLALDFEKFSFNEGADYIRYGGYTGAVSVEGKTAKIGGAAANSGIAVLNAFGNGECAKAGNTYLICGDIGAGEDADVTVAVIDKDKNIIESAVYSVKKDMISAFEFGYTAENSSACAVAIFADKDTDITLGSLEVKDKDEESIVIDKMASIDVSSAKETEDTRKFYEISVSSSDGSVFVNGEDKGSAYTGQHETGDVITLKTAGEGEFLYWIDMADRKIISKNESFDFTVGTAKTIAAVYAQKNAAFVTFTSLGTTVLAAGEAQSFNVPKDPYVYGYEFAGWYDEKDKLSAYKSGDLVTDAKNESYKAGFVRKETKYKITVNGDEKTYLYNDKVTVIAEAKKDGKAFSYWEKDGKIVSYDLQYGFYANEDSVVNAVYGASADKKCVLVMSNPAIVDTNKIAFFAERDIPEKYEIIENGIILSTENNVTLDNCRVKAAAKNTQNQGQFTIRKKNVGAGETWHGRAYVIYRDSTGEIVTIYSNEVFKTI